MNAVPDGRWACCAGSGNRSPSSRTPASLCPPVCPISSLALSASRSFPPFLPGYIFSPTSNLWGQNGATSLVSLPPVPSVELPFLSHSLGPWGGARGRRGPAQPPLVPLACTGQMREADWAMPSERAPVSPWQLCRQDALAAAGQGVTKSPHSCGRQSFVRRLEGAALTCPRPAGRGRSGGSAGVWCHSRAAHFTGRLLCGFSLTLCFPSVKWASNADPPPQKLCEPQSGAWEGAAVGELRREMGPEGWPGSLLCPLRTWESGPSTPSRRPPSQRLSFPCLLPSCAAHTETSPGSRAPYLACPGGSYRLLVSVRVVPVSVLSVPGAGQRGERQDPGLRQRTLRLSPPPCRWLPVGPWVNSLASLTLTFPLC